MKEAKNWVLAVVCPYCGKQLSINEKYISVLENNVYVKCYKCYSIFKIFTLKSLLSERVFI